MQYGVSFLGGVGETNCAHPSVVPTEDQETAFCVPVSPSQARSSQHVGKERLITYPVTWQKGRHPSLFVCLCFSLVYWSLTKDLALASFSVYHCENFLGSLSIFPLLFSQALINLLGASPGTPSNSYGAKDLLRRRRAAPTAAPVLWYNTDTAGISCEANIIRSFFHPLSYGANGDFFKKKKYLWSWEFQYLTPRCLGERNVCNY